MIFFYILLDQFHVHYNNILLFSTFFYILILLCFNSSDVYKLLFDFNNWVPFGALGVMFLAPAMSNYSYMFSQMCDCLSYVNNSTTTKKTTVQ